MPKCPALRARPRGTTAAPAPTSSVLSVARSSVSYCHHHRPLYGSVVTASASPRSSSMPSSTNAAAGTRKNGCQPNYYSFSIAMKTFNLFLGAVVGILYIIAKPSQPGACFRCGRHGHWIAQCYARTHIDGHSL